MIVKLLFLLALSAPLWGAPNRDQVALQEVRSSFQELSYRINSHQVELDLLLERLQALEEKTGRLNQSSSTENRLSQIEKNQKSLASDFKTLKGHLEKTNSSLTSCQSKLTQLDKQLSTDIKSLKNSLQSMVVLLKGGNEGKIYTVKPGDSLGKIALNLKTDTKTLKSLNNLSADTIYVGQKLKLP